MKRIAQEMKEYFLVIKTTRPRVLGVWIGWGLGQALLSWDVSFEGVFSAVIVAVVGGGAVFILLWEDPRRPQPDVEPGMIGIAKGSGVTFAFVSLAAALSQKHHAESALNFVMLFFIFLMLGYAVHVGRSAARASAEANGGVQTREE